MVVGRLQVEPYFRQRVFTHEECDLIVDLIKQQEEGRWFYTRNIKSIPTDKGTASAYYFLGNAQQSKTLNKTLYDMAPAIEGLYVTEWIVNRYDVGGYMPEHIDYQKNLVNLSIAMQEKGDGLSVGDIFYPDEKGVGTYFGHKTPPHSVPKVNSQRYSVIYLYG